VRPDQKYKLLSTDSAERAAQETDAVLATTARLIKEMAVLIEQSQDLLKRHEALLHATRSTKIDKK
jgi:hypothetical protein